MNKFAFISAAVITVSGCTSIDVRPVDPALQMSHVCIQENPKVLVTDFVQVVEDGFERNGISTEIISNNTTSKCEYILTYTALRSWDFTPYLSHAEIRIKNAGRQIAYGEYHLNGKGGLDMTKWKGTKAKMDPVIDKMLQSR